MVAAGVQWATSQDLVFFMGVVPPPTLADVLYYTHRCTSTPAQGNRLPAGDSIGTGDAVLATDETKRVPWLVPTIARRCLTVTVSIVESEFHIASSGPAGGFCFASQGSM